MKNNANATIGTIIIGDLLTLINNNCTLVKRPLKKEYDDANYKIYYSYRKMRNSIWSEWSPWQLKAIKPSANTEVRIQRIPNIIPIVYRPGLSSYVRS